MEINPLAKSNSKPDASTANSALDKLTDDFDTFLKLLTTQLQNQDPLNPMDTHEMTAQLVQFTQVEQQVAQNRNLEKLVNLQTASADAAAVSYIGHKVQVEGGTTNVPLAGTTWGYEFETPPNSVTLNVLDGSGKLVFTADGETTAGIRHAFDWDLTDADGATLGPGSYTMNVSALDAEGKAITATVDSIGEVSGVQSSATGPELLIGNDIVVALSKVLKVQ